MKRPIKNCYWVVPGQLLAGEYPRNADDESSAAKMAALKEAGVEVFIDLTEGADELEPYAQWAEPARHVRIPVRDVSVPYSAADTVAALNLIDDSIGAGKTVYVHCWGGVGRTGVIVGCWLAREYGSGHEALGRLAELWKECPKSTDRHSPETREQRDYVRTWREEWPTQTVIREEARYCGCLLGLAVGDAVGTSVEFKPPGTFFPVTDMVGGGPFDLKPGEWTDDTSMALCLAESLAECDGFNPRDQMERYVRWREEGYLSSTGKAFDIGATVDRALRRFKEDGIPFAGDTDPSSAGNGSLMRLAPVPLFFALDPEQAIRLSGESSRTTHGAQASVDACRYFGGLIVGAIRGVPKAELLSPRYSPVAGMWNKTPLCPEIDDVARGSFLRKEPPEIVGSGYVAESLEAALWAFANSDHFRSGCLLAVNFGNDAGTTAAIYGQIAGAYYGEDGIPRPWLRRVAKQSHIRRLASRLGRHSIQWRGYTTAPLASSGKRRTALLSRPFSRRSSGTRTGSNREVQPDKAEEKASGPYHVVQNANGGWAVLFGDDEKVLLTFDTESEAAEYAKRRNLPGSRFVEVIDESSDVQILPAGRQRRRSGQPSKPPAAKSTES